MTSVTAPPSATVPRAGLYAWYVATLLSLAHLISFVDRFVMSLVLEPVKADLGISDAQLGLLQGTSFVILYTVATVPLGRLADRVNRRNIIIAGIVVWSVATALCGLASSFAELFAARVLVGFGEAALVPAAMSMMASYFPRSQIGRAVSLFTTGASLGKSAALIGGGAVLAMLTAAGGMPFGPFGTLAPWQGTFVVMALPGIALAILLFSAREPARPVTSAARPSFADAWRYVLARRAAFFLHTGAAALTVMTIQTLAAWGPTFYIRFFDLTAPEAGLAIGSVILIAAPLGHLTGGFLTDMFQLRGSRAPAAPVIALGLTCAIPVLLLFTTSTSLTLSLVAYGAVNFFATMAAPATLAGVQMLAPDRLRGTLTSLFLATTTLVGIGVGPALVGLTTDLMGGPDQLARSTGIVVGIVAAGGVLLALASRRPFAAAATPD
ncbi:MFS transporter [Sphingomonas sp.]|uniref:MFS transporter n=1 Tax=Sphingomonas sp. TaxID=28214 RepID=UPI002DD64537|nr:MFS transporter [Sphingomonas sp.]